jgi:hypothetical protein
MHGLFYAVAAQHPAIVIIKMQVYQKISTFLDCVNYEKLIRINFNHSDYFT